MTIRYANDLLLSDLARQITLEHGSMNDYLRDGYLHGAFLRAQNLMVKLEKLQARLNDLKYERE